MGKTYDVAIIGCGSRGGDAYGRLMHGEKDKFRITALCDVDLSKTEKYAEEFGVSPENVFNDETEFFRKKRGDVLVIATQDKDHVRMCLKAFETGYDVLLEKPISPDLEELNALLAAHKKYKKHVLVCHVLRYAPAYLKLYELLKSGAIGRLVRMEATENVGFWHQAHSFVRGNWRNSEETSPMIMAKCCHDLDLIQWYADSECESVYSTGDLSFFKAENQPAGAADRCADCKYINDCPYSAENLYVKRFKANFNCQGWPYNVVDGGKVITEESLRKAYTENEYGRCVFKCDNDAVDNQSVEMVFKNGVKATLVMTAFSDAGYRRYVFHGTYGDMVYDETERAVKLSVFGKEKEIISVDELLKDSKSTGFGHGGGDYGIVSAFYDVLEGKGDESTGLEKSVESHLIALKAERSRLSGKAVLIHEE